MSGNSFLETSFKNVSLRMDSVIELAEDCEELEQEVRSWLEDDKATLNTLSMTNLRLWMSLKNTMSPS